MAMVGKIEEEYARSSVEQAKDFLRDGKYSKALHLLCRAERILPHSQGVNELIAITEVCCAAAWRCSCKRQYPKPKNPDWYRVLKVDETADTSVLKKRYRQLALLLHPDKNKNCKAEEAFKLVSEAYACLSDRGLRAAFTSERIRTFCVRCSLSEPTNRHERAHSKAEDQNEQPKCDQERLQEFRERARARVSKLTEDIKTRRSRINADLETVREKYQNKRVNSKIWEEVLERPIRESDVFQPTTNQPRRRFQVADASLMGILRDRRNLQREKLISSQSLQGFLSMLKSDMRSSSVRHRDAAGTSSSKSRRRSSQVAENCNSFDSQQAEEPIAPRCSSVRTSLDEQQATKNSVDGSGITDRFFFKRVSSVTDSLPAKKLFREDNGSDKEHSSNADDEPSSDSTKCGSPEEDVRGDRYPIFERPSRAASTCLRNSTSSMSENLEPVHSTAPARPRTVAETEPEIRTPSVSKSRAIPIGDEEVSSTRRGTAQTVWTSGCCSKTTMLKEQRQKSEELLKTLERLREEARSVAETLDKLKRGAEF